MMADPPMWLPWLILALFVVLFTWGLFWPSPQDEPEEEVASKGDLNLQNHSGSGDNVINR